MAEAFFDLLFDSLSAPTSSAREASQKHSATLRWRA